MTEPKPKDLVGSGSAEAEHLIESLPDAERDPTFSGKPEKFRMTDVKQPEFEIRK